ncbi:unnamed protein product [Trifolium pratense]|uniref:Uncharacterized protein n=1 Tax=Trifolium pratense TaxID=57577 RepID=A0ACB0LKP9_TRIPR|nr:unnamed protein product [Trifolium pratense]
MTDHAVNLPAGAGASTSSSGLALANALKDKRQIFASFLRLLDIRKTPSHSEEQAVEAINCFKLLYGEHVDAAFVEGLSPIYRDFALQLLTGNHVDMETLSPNSWQRVKVLKYLQNEYDKLETEALEEKVQLHAKYMNLYEPLYTKRYEIVNGVIDVEGITNEAAEEKGVPSFWLTAMKNNTTLAEEITERDKEALKYLKDIKWCRLCNPRIFKLEFYFDSNPYFQNSVLTKTYHILKDIDPIVEKSTGTEIEW